MTLEKDGPADTRARQAPTRGEPSRAPAAARRLLVVFNPTAGWGQHQRLRAVLKELSKLGCVVRLRETSGPGDAESLARQASGKAAEFDAVVAAGGDGTVNEMVNGLGMSGKPLGLIPLGTANVLAREIGQDLEPRAVARTLAFGPLLEASVGEANDRKFLLMAGVGFDARAVADVNIDVKRQLGKGAYILAGLKNLLRGGFARYAVRIDGVEHEAYSVIIANARSYGGAYVIAPDARLERPVFEVCLFQIPGRMAVIRYALALKFGWLPRARGFRIVPGREVDVTFDEAQPPADEPIQGDGDVLTRMPLSARIVPNALRLIVPEDYPAARG
ncbi:MAG: diacylglycerol kinase family lipid kinase [Rhodovibrionaceae bacterium]|nr:diacylglycerol kinase family lipid kinase [Rhodovibrionaceae bacterium]